ncbi:di-/tricarboxylate transporter [Corynebacterium mustelae]|uniref:Di-/tricarboxylate transporter n=1 Tax=Corynebacterium mustelae TaxID=571915 RepID=A0A0G3GWM9_9CORY|nr:SLC13 family permease [Corynebacterium mustelae]AKK05581.1 di-/tricarboxylate transporter [Corynebacterium mustelae]
MTTLATQNRRLRGHVEKLVALIAIAAVLYFPTSLSIEARLTLAVFIGAIFLWVFSTIPDTYVALAAASLLAVLGILSAEDFFEPLGHDTTWLLIGAFIIATAVTSSGLALRVTSWLSVGITSPRTLVHLVSLALVCTAFMVPATSGRAALVLPVFLALVPILESQHRWLLVTLSIAMPSVVLLSAVASFIGAGAHLITDQILSEQDLGSIGFSAWMLYGLPFAVVSSHVSAEVILLLTSTKGQRQQRLQIGAQDFPDTTSNLGEKRSLAVLFIAVALWFTESIHSIPPALVAVVCALLIASPSFGAVDLNQAIKKIPWSLLLFMTATVALSEALSESGAAEAMASGVFSLVGGSNAAWMFIAIVIALSTAAHLFIQSRSARSAVLIPIVIALAPACGVNPVAAAFLSTAAAGFCHTLPSSAKPLTIFYCEDQSRPSFTNAQLMRISATLAPIHMILLAIFSTVIWPALGLHLFQ